MNQGNSGEIGNTPQNEAPIEINTVRQKKLRQAVETAEAEFSTAEAEYMECLKQYADAVGVDVAKAATNHQNCRSAVKRLDRARQGFRNLLRAKTEEAKTNAEKEIAAGLEHYVRGHGGSVDQARQKLFPLALVRIIARKNEAYDQAKGWEKRGVASEAWTAAMAAYASEVRIPPEKAEEHFNAVQNEDVIGQKLQAALCEKEAARINLSKAEAALKQAEQPHSQSTGSPAASQRPRSRR